MIRIRSTTDEHLFFVEEDAWFIFYFNDRTTFKSIEELIEHVGKYSPTKAVSFYVENFKIISEFEEEIPSTKELREILVEYLI